MAEVQFEDESNDISRIYTPNESSDESEPTGMIKFILKTGIVKKRKSAERLLLILAGCALVAAGGVSYFFIFAANSKPTQYNLPPEIKAQLQHDALKKVNQK